MFKKIAEYIRIANLQKQIAGFFPSYHEQKSWIDKLNNVDRHVKSAHNPSHILQFLVAILKISPSSPGCIVEAGAYKGGGTSKISLFTAHMKRKLFVFDSFEGLPENDEQHLKSTEGHSIENWFKGGNFSGSLEEVQANVSKYGDISVCQFRKGWFENTLPTFKEPIALAYLDVDLASSTKTCLKYLYPLLVKGGAIYSQDGDFPLVIDVFKDENFWLQEIGCTELPEIEGLGQKITVIRKK